jgi:hypothetical protein
VSYNIKTDTIEVDRKVKTREEKEGVGGLEF